MDRSQRIGAILLSGAAVGLIAGIVLRPQTPPSPEPAWKERARAQQEKPAASPLVPTEDSQERDLVWNSLVRNASSAMPAGFDMGGEFAAYGDKTAAYASGPADVDDYPSAGQYVVVPKASARQDVDPAETRRLKESLLVYRGPAKRN